MQVDTASILAFFALVALIFVGWRANRAPGSDRAMLKQQARLSSRLAVLEEGFKGCATRSDMAALAVKIDSLEEHTASAGDINALEGKVNVLQAEVAANRQETGLTRRGVERLENFFIQKGIER